jgi:ElaB/YqjD/DUF883 family membrane-anchored ribosome-binding protein
MGRSQAQTAQEALSTENAMKVYEVQSRGDVKSLLAQVSESKQELKAWKRVNSDEERDTLTDVIGEAKSRVKKWEEARTSITGPINELLGAVNRFFIPPRDEVSALCKTGERLINDYNNRKALEAQKAKERAEKEAQRVQKKFEKAGMVAPVIQVKTPEPETTARGNVASSFQKKPWTFEIENKMELVRAVVEGKADEALVILNESLIRSMVKGGVRKLPGVKIFQTTDTTVRRR